MKHLLLAAVLASILPGSASAQSGDPPATKDVWQPAKTPAGGTPWKLLEATKLIDRKGKDGIIYTKPAFTPQVLALRNKRVKIAGWMMPLENGKQQKHFVLLGYPPGCPFHFHAMPNQFVEVVASTPVPTDQMKMHVISGTLVLTGQDESGIFYKLIDATAT